ncbi:unnamed protein product [Effrenium voratum]|nr:unnamed protein product [Effrenium voratum]
MERSLAALPKAELHLHLEGAMRSETLTELCGRHGVQRPMDTRGKTFPDFSPFATAYMAVCECLREEADLRRLVLEVAEDAAKYGAMWIEPALSIELYAHRFGGLESTLHLLLKAAQAAEDATGVGIGFIVAAERHLPPEKANALAVAVKNVAASCQGRGIAGFGLHSAEVGHPPEPFADAFRLAELPALPHAGEFPPARGQGPQSVRFCVDGLGARRIAHGVLAMEDDELILHLAKLGVCLDICPSSNELLGVVPVKDSPLKRFLDAGIPCTINSDDPLLFGCDLLGEFERCRKELKMTDDRLAACAANSFQHSRAPEELKRRGLRGVEEWLQRQRLLAAVSAVFSSRMRTKRLGVWGVLSCLLGKQGRNASVCYWSTDKVLNLCPGAHKRVSDTDESELRAKRPLGWAGHRNLPGDRDVFVGPCNISVPVQLLLFVSSNQCEVDVAGHFDAGLGQQWAQLEVGVGVLIACSVETSLHVPTFHLQESARGLGDNHRGAAEPGESE